MSNRRGFIAALGSAAAWPVVARAQQNALPVIAYISVRAVSRSDALRNFYQLFVQGLSETGFVDHRNVIIDHREAADVGQIPAIGADLVRNTVAVIYGPTSAIIAAKAVTSTIPMVFVGATDPVAGVLSSASIGPEAM
jgi:putative tryptophan/tyrosine transport system substrate-binding protein